MIIKNHLLSSRFNLKGAELISLKNKEGTEYIWQADPVHWGRHSPVLFPVVGRLREDSFLFEEQRFSMGQHGFARDLPFEIEEQGEDFISFLLASNPSTKKVYPFDFELRINYQLEENQLITSYSVVNPGSEDLFFSIGGHPAFNCPLQPGEERADYWLLFESNENGITHRLKEGLFTGETSTVFEGKKLVINDTLFDEDALVFKELKSGHVSLVSPAKEWLTFSFEGFPYLGIWSKSRTSPFICIEPWYGLADTEKHHQQLKNKEGIISLPSEESFAASYAVEIH